MNQDRLRELLNSPLDDRPPRRPWLPWVAGMAVGALVVGGAFLFRGGDESGEPTPTTPSGTPAAVTERAQTTTTTLPGVPASPESAFHHQLVYDPGTGRILLTGGTRFLPNNPSRPGEAVRGTWGYDAAGAWLEYPTAPPARAGYAAAADTAAGRVVLFGGTSTPFRVCGVFGPCTSEVLGDTWLLNPASGRWEPTTPSQAPAARYGAAMAYDSQSRKLVLFGGAAMQERSFQNDPFGDTWSYDVASDTWTELSPITAPPARAWHRMVYDPDGDRILLFGGTGGGELDGRVWAYDVDANRWEASAATGPEGRWTPIAAFDTESRALVVVGGHGPVVRTIGEGVTATDMRWWGDVWVYRPAVDHWQVLPELEGNIPWGSGAYDPDRDQVVARFFLTTGLFDLDTGEWTFVDDPEVAD